MQNLSSIFKIAFILVIAAMIVLVVIALLNRPAGPLTQEQVEQTVIAAVNIALTETAVVATPTALPDIDATVAARLASTPVPTSDPNLIPESDLQASGGVIALVGGLINGVFSVLRGIWNLFSFGGIGLQLCCCLIIPLGALAALARESM